MIRRVRVTRLGRGCRRAYISTWVPSRRRPNRGHRLTLPWIYAWGS